MKKTLRCGLLVLLLLVFILQIPVFSQPIRLAVLPFQNRDGDLKLNIWSYKLQDSVFNALKEQDPEENYYHLVPMDSVEAILFQLNTDPTNPQFPSDMWKAVDSLNVKEVVSGNFNFEDEKFLINAYVFNVRLKLPNPRYQARDIFKREEVIMEAVPEIIESLIPALIPENE